MYEYIITSKYDRLFGGPNHHRDNQPYAIICSLSDFFVWHKVHMQYWVSSTSYPTIKTLQSVANNILWKQAL